MDGRTALDIITCSLAPIRPHWPIMDVIGYSLSPLSKLGDPYTLTKYLYRLVAIVSES